MDPVCRYHYVRSFDKTIRANKGKRIAVAGLGGRFEWFFSISLSHLKKNVFTGLGQMGSKLTRALGCHVTVLSRNPSKENFAKGPCKANAFVCTGPVYKKDMEKFMERSI